MQRSPEPSSSSANFALIWFIWTLPFVYSVPAMEPETIPPKRIRQSDLWSEPGGLSRRVLDALRRAGAPIRAPNLVRAVMIDTGLDPADRASFVRVQWKVRRHREPPQQTWTARVGWRRPRRPSGGSPIRRFDELPPSGDAAANIPPTQVTADGPVPGGHRHGIGFRVASRRMSSRHAISPAYWPR